MTRDVSQMYSITCSVELISVQSSAFSARSLDRCTCVRILLGFSVIVSVTNNKATCQPHSDFKELLECKFRTNTVILQS